MPHVIQGAPSTPVRLLGKQLTDKQLKRKYKPFFRDGPDFSVGGKLHDRIVGEVITRAREGERAISKRWSQWDVIDKTLTSFIEPNALDKEVKGRDEQAPISIVVPESLATLETFLTYMASVFGDSPMFAIEGAGPEDLLGGILLEKLIELQIQRSHLLLELMQQWRDAVAYGFGVLSPTWGTRFGKRSRAIPITETDPITGEIIVVGFDRIREDVVTYEGVNAFSIDNRQYLPDPTTPIHKPQGGEFVGWVQQTNFATLSRDENADDGDFFNVDYLRKMPHVRTSIFQRGETAAREAEGSFAEDREDAGSSFPIDIINMYVDLIPNDWDLGTSKEPEKWLFIVASDQILISGHPMDLDHGMFPLTVAAPDSGGHEFVPPSRLEMLHGYQLFANYLLNTHIIETDKMIKNRLVVDPKMANMADVRENKSYIRLRPSVWGRGVAGAVEQLKMQDVTRGHMADLSQVIQLSRQHGGSVDSLLGIARQGGERVTKAEFEGTRGSALSRLQRLATIISKQSMLPLATLMVSHTQQFMSQSTWVKTMGQTEDILRKEYDITDPRVLVTPFNIDVNFDITIKDSSVLGGESAGDWIQWLQVAMQIPELAIQQLDLPRIHLHIARLMGNKAPEQFMLNRSFRGVVVPDAFAMDQAAAGNLVEVGGGSNGNVR